MQGSHWLNSVSLFCDRHTARSTGFFPPDLGVLGTVEHLGQFLLNLTQTSGAKFEGGLLHFAVHTLSRVTGIHVLEVADFLAQAGEEIFDIRHLFNHTLCRARVPVTKSIPKTSHLASCTVNAFALVAVFRAFVTEIFPELAVAGTVTRIKLSVSTLKLALLPLIATPGHADKNIVSITKQKDEKHAFHH